MSESETEPSETKPRKVVGRGVVIAIGAVCVLLIAGLIGAFAYYVTVVNSEIADKNNTISQLNSQIAAQNNQINDLNATVNLAKSTAWMYGLYLNFYQRGGVTHFQADYAGYVLAVASSSSAFNVSVELSYTLSNGISYDRTAYIGSESSSGSSGNSAGFPILPSEVEVNVTNLSPYASVVASVTYYY
jgi:cell division protein FtsL